MAEHKKSAAYRGQREPTNLSAGRKSSQKKKKTMIEKGGKKIFGGTRKMRNEMFYKSGKLKPFSSALPFRFVGFRWFEFES